MPRYALAAKQEACYLLQHSKAMKNRWGRRAGGWGSAACQRKVRFQPLLEATAWTQEPP